MSADRFHDGEDIEPAPVRELRPAPGLDRSGETRGRHELVEENADLGRAVGELASENADLCKRIDALEAKLKTEQARFGTWAKEMANREDTRAARDETRAKREEAMADRIAELERGLAERQDAPDARPLPGRFEERSGAREEAERRRPGRGKPSNEIIAVGVAWSAIALTAISELKGTPGAATVTAYAAEGIGVVAAQLAWYRKRKEEGSSDRSQG